MVKTIKKTPCAIFLRHPYDIPIKVFALSPSESPNANFGQVEKIGLVFRSDVSLDINILVKITIPIVEPDFELLAYTCRCLKRGSAYEVGVVLMKEEDVMRVRMVEQICYIEHYRRVESEKVGHLISGNEAALKWVQKYAAKFPNLTVPDASLNSITMQV